MRSRLALMLILGSALGCPGTREREFGPPGPASDAGMRPDGSPVATSTPADVLFIVDNSGSMAEEQEKLAEGFGRFLSAVQADLHVAVVSTDQMSPNGERIGLQTFVYANESPNILIGFDDSTCIDTDVDHGCARGPDATLRILDSMALAPLAMAANFAKNVRLGTCGFGTEQGLRSLLAALGQRDGCNEGFVREEANLVVIFVSDEDDEDTLVAADVLSVVSTIKSMERVRMGAIIGAVDGVASACGVGIGSGCGSTCQSMPPAGSQAPCSTTMPCGAGEYCEIDRCENELLRYWSACRSCTFYATPNCCSAEAGTRYVELLDLLESGSPEPQTHVESICQDDLGEALDRLARRLVGGEFD